MSSKQCFGQISLLKNWIGIRSRGGLKMCFGGKKHGQPPVGETCAFICVRTLTETIGLYAQP